MYSYILILFFSLIFHTTIIVSVDLQKHQRFCVDYLLKNDDQKGFPYQSWTRYRKNLSISWLMQKRKKRSSRYLASRLVLKK